MEVIHLIDQIKPSESSRAGDVSLLIPSNGLETLACDITSILFFGITCPLAELGYNPEGADKLQINVALLVTKHERIPVAHSVYEGSRHGVATVKNFLLQTTKMQSAGGTLIWDRGMVSKENVEAAEGLGWSIICGLPKSVKAVDDALEKEVPFKPETLVRYETTKIYAIETYIQLYGKERRIIIYKNSTRATNEADERNASLAKISEKLSELQKKGAKWNEAALRWLIENRGIESDKGTWGASEKLLRVLGRVERLEVTIDNSQRTWYLNLLKKTKEQLKKIGYGEIFEK